MSHHAATQTQTTMEGGERCTFSSWKYRHYFEFMSAKDENIKVLVHSVLVTKYYQASKT